MGSVVLPLAGWSGLRARCLGFGLALVGVVALSVVGIWMAGAFLGAFLGSAPGLGDLVVLVLMVLPLLAGGAAFAAPALGPRPALEVMEDVLVVRYPGLGLPLVVPRTAVALAAVDRVPSRHALPTLTLQAFDRPNLAIRFREPVATTAPPWWMRIGLDKMYVGGRPVDGVLLRVADPATAAHAFSRWGRLGRLDVPDDPLIRTGGRASPRDLLLLAAVVVAMVIRHAW